MHYDFSEIFPRYISLTKYLKITLCNILSQQAKGEKSHNLNDVNSKPIRPNVASRYQV